MDISSAIIRKLTTKPIWYWERKRPYLSKFGWRRLPRLRVKCPSSSLKINILCTPNTCAEAVFSAWSWCNHLGHLFGVRIVVDGPVPHFLKVSALEIIEGLEIETVDELISPSLYSYPHLSAFGAQHPLGRKLLLLLSLQEHDGFLYSDNDVLVLNTPYELISACQKKISVYNQESTGASFDHGLLAFALRHGALPASSFNSGLIYCSRHSLDISFADQMLSIKSTSNYTWFDEQTVLAILMNRVDAKPLSSSTYVVSARRQFFWEQDVDYGSIHVRHFTGPVRHLMYLKGYPMLLKAAVSQ